MCLCESANKKLTFWPDPVLLQYTLCMSASPVISSHRAKVSLWTCVWSEGCSVVSDSLWPHGLYSSWNSPGQNTWLGSLSLLQGIFPAKGSNPGLPHCRQILYQLSHKGSPRILEWVAYPFSSWSSWPRKLTWASCIAGRFFTNCAGGWDSKASACNAGDLGSIPGLGRCPGEGNGNPL